MSRRNELPEPGAVETFTRVPSGRSTREVVRCRPLASTQRRTCVSFPRKEFWVMLRVVPAREGGEPPPPGGGFAAPAGFCGLGAVPNPVGRSGVRRVGAAVGRGVAPDLGAGF